MPKKVTRSRGTTRVVSVLQPISERRQAMLETAERLATLESTLRIGWKRTHNRSQITRNFTRVRAHLRRRRQLGDDDAWAEEPTEPGEGRHAFNHWPTVRLRR